MYIRVAGSPWYIHEVRGVNYLSWVHHTDRAHSLIFPEADITQWLSTLQTMCGMELEAVAIN